MAKQRLCLWLDCRVHTNPKVIRLAEILHLDTDAAVGKLCRLWAWAKMGGIEDGNLGPLPTEELSMIMGWRKRPALLLDALLESGLMEIGPDGDLFLHDWYDINGKSTEKMRKDRERKQN